MRILIVGAGAVGGYFGGQLLNAGLDVTFLVRKAKAERLKKNGLVLKTSEGKITLPHPKLILADEIKQHYDLILLSCKAYDLKSAIDSFRPAVGPETMILPLLNGMSHVNTLLEAFSEHNVLGGLCKIVATVDEEDAIVNFTAMQSITFGERSGNTSERTQKVLEAFQRASFQTKLSGNVLQEMWEKWLFLSSLAASTCLMRAPVGNIVNAPGGTEFMLAMIDEIKAIAIHSGFPPSQECIEQTQKMLTEKGSSLTASMYRDLIQGSRIEADHVIGDLLVRAKKAGKSKEAFPLICTTMVQLKAYESMKK